MVRSKPKKQKGDEAFTTRKQKVGRKKLAPVTTTRAEVHARTLHIATSTAMAKATAAEAAAEPSNNNNNNKNNNNNNSKAIQVLNYSELLSGAQHYKSANRSSALTTMSRLLLMQEEVDLKALAAGDMFSGFIALPSSTRKPQPTAPAGAGSSSSGLTGVSPLEKLKSFAAALEAMTDTDNDARKAALQCVKIIIRHQWLSSSQTAHTTRETAAVQQMIARETGNAEEMLSMMGSSVVEREHTRAVLQAVHVCLTHALKSVRMSGVELLGLLLTYAPAGAVRRAARDVCHQQRTYLAFSLDDDDVKSSNAKKTHGDMQSLAAKEEEEWMLTLARRVSALVMKTPHMWVLPELLAAFWMDTTNNDNSSADNASINHSGLFSSSSSSQVGVFHYGASKDWRHPLLVQAFFDDVLPQWSNAWKELQELRLTLFRHEDKLLCAIALGRSFALVLTFLKQKQMEEQQRCMMAGEEGGAVRKASVASQLFLSRNKQQLIKNLFIHRVPVTMEEILLGSSSSSSNASRLEFALVLAQVCGPLAGSDDGWKVLHHYFNGMFPKTNSNSTAAPQLQLSAGALLQSLQLFLIVLRMFPRSVHTPRLHGEAAADHHSSNHGVTEKLITFVPGILRSVIQHVGICADAAASSAARASSSADDAVLMQVLLVTAQVVDCVSQYPLPSEYKADNRQRSVAVALEMSFSLVPRLLFALRLHYKTAAIAKPSEEQGNTGMDNEEEGGTSQLVVTSVSSHGVLQQHPLLVDMVVAAFLRTYWFIASSGHPLLLQANNNNNSSNSDGNKDAGNAFRQTLRQSLSSLFGLSMGSQAVEGVLARCTERTAEVARHVMFYIPSGADTQQQHLRVVRQGEGAAGSEESPASAARDEEGEEVFAWGDLLSALPCVFS